MTIFVCFRDILRLLYPRDHRLFVSVLSARYVLLKYVGANKPWPCEKILSLFTKSIRVVSMNLSVRMLKVPLTMLRIFEKLDISGALTGWVTLMN